MTKLYIPRHALALAVVALVAACGGGETPTRTATQTFSDALASQQAVPSNRLRAMAAGGGSTGAAAVAITDTQLFQGAEAIFPDLFPVAVAPTSISNLSHEGKIFQVRAYANGNYLGVANDGFVYGLGAFTGGGLAKFDAKQSYADLVCSRINCGSTGDSTGPVGPLNGCTEGASVGLTPGRTYHAVYISSALVAPTSTGEYTVDSIVNGAASFADQATVKMTTTAKGKQFGVDVDTNVLTYHQAAEFDLTRTVGSELTTTLQGITTSIKLVNTAPASLNNEFSLALGGSMSKTETTTTTTVFTGLPLPPQQNTNSTTSSHTYEARESVTVPAGTFSTCRYKLTTAGVPGSTLSWVIVGRGIAARNESRTDAGAVEHRLELKAATINGAPI